MLIFVQLLVHMTLIHAVLGQLLSRWGGGAKCDLYMHVVLSDLTVYA